MPTAQRRVLRICTAGNDDDHQAREEHVSGDGEGECRNLIHNYAIVDVPVSGSSREMVFLTDVSLRRSHAAPATVRLHAADYLGWHGDQ